MNTNGDGSGLPKGWPDVSELERLANEMFAAKLGSGLDSIPSTANGHHGIGAYPESAPSTLASASQNKSGTAPLAGSPAVGLPHEDEWRAQFLTVPLPSSPATEAAQWILPMSAPSFYFLEGYQTNPVSDTRALQAVTGSGMPVPTLDSSIPISTAAASAPFDVNRVRNDFPILQSHVHGRPLVWLDNAATTQKPQPVIDRVKYFYEHENSNIHRAAHELAARATDAYEQAREKVRGFLNASSVNEIVFVRGATEAINLVAQTWGRKHVSKDDEIVITWLEHHANIVPWQQLATETGARLRVAQVDENGQVLLDDYGQLLGPKTKLVSFAHVSNALGTITPVKQMVEMASAVGARVLVDGAQAVSHMPVDLQDLNPDWYVFSGHKIFAPTGIGVLYGKEALLNEMPPWHGGGNMIKDVTFERTLYQDAPWRFEAGTGSIADAVGLGAAIDYVSKLGMELISQYEHQLLVYATRLLNDIPGLKMIGTAPEKASVLSFVLDGVRTEDVGAALSREGIAVRSGHHCAQPILRRFGVEATVRPSLAFYNTCADVDALIMALIRLTSSGAGTAPNLAQEQLTLPPGFRYR